MQDSMWSSQWNLSLMLQHILNLPVELEAFWRLGSLGGFIETNNPVPLDELTTRGYGLHHRHSSSHPYLSYLEQSIYDFVVSINYQPTSFCGSIIESSQQFRHPRFSPWIPWTARNITKESLARGLPAIRWSLRAKPRSVVKTKNNLQNLWDLVPLVCKHRKPSNFFTQNWTR